MQLIRGIITEDPSRHRFALSQVVCERLDWRRANGQLKDMSCRAAMLRMHRDGLIQLPPPRRRHYNSTLHRHRTPQGGTGVTDHRPRRCATGCTYDRSPISATRSPAAGSYLQIKAASAVSMRPGADGRAKATHTISLLLTLPKRLLYAASQDG